MYRLSQGHWEMRRDEEVVQNLYFVMISLSPRNELKNQLGYLWLKKIVGDNPRCSACQAKGVVLCTTCAGSGLYVDSILESQGIIVKVRCLGVKIFSSLICKQVSWMFMQSCSTFVMFLFHIVIEGKLYSIPKVWFCVTDG